MSKTVTKCQNIANVLDWRLSGLIQIVTKCRLTSRL